MDRRARLTQAAVDLYGAEPELWVRAPGRVDLMGSHTDYNLGCVLTLAIGPDVWLALRPRADARVRLHSLNLDRGTEFALPDPAHSADEPWSNYARGVAVELAAAGYGLTGFDGVLHSTVPIGSGLSSSAAVECALAVAWRALGGWEADPVRLAQLCQRAENRFVGVNCGILDQYTSLVSRAGCALLLDCRDLTSRPAPLAAGLSVVIADTRAPRELSGSEYGERRAQCEEGARLLGAASLREVSPARFAAAEASLPPVVARRCRFILEEHARVAELAQALTTGDRARIDQSCRDSFAGACALYEIGVPAMVAMHAALLAAPGAVGARQAGAGFGGCLVALVESAQVPAFCASVHETYLDATGVAPAVFEVAAADGAGLLT